MIRVLCNHRFIPRNGIIGSGAFFIFERNSERVEELEIWRKAWNNFQASCSNSFAIRTAPTRRKGKFLSIRIVSLILSKKKSLE